MNRFNHRDFTNDPEKYRTFKSAKIATNVFTHNGEHDLAEGTLVAIKYMDTVWNQMLRRNEPVYTLIDHPHQLYASALCDFND